MRPVALAVALALLLPLAGAVALPLKAPADAAALLRHAHPLDAPPLVRGHSLAPATAGSYRIEFQCPEPPLGGGGLPCPLRIIDSADALGNPALAVDPLYPEHMAFASLHGQQGFGPSHLSRDGQTHTTFTSLTFGVDWRDNPYSPPSPPYDSGRIVFGEDVHMIMDAVGNMHVASLYSHSDASDPNATWENTIVNWKFDATLDVLSYAFPAGAFTPREARHAIETHWLLELPDSDEVLLLWRERAGAWNASLGPAAAPPARVVGARTPADPFSPWTPLDDKLAVGPCADTTNPVLHSGRVYLGCVAGANFTAFPAVEPGEIVVYELDPLATSVRAVSKAPLTGGSPRLAADAQGRLALVAADVVDGERVRLRLATGDVDGAWSKPREVDAHNGTRGVAEARVNAVLYRGGTNTVHMIYLERANATDVRAGEPMWRKSLLVADALGTVLVNLDLDLSDKGDVYTYSDPPDDEAIFGDTRDSLIEVNGREFMAFADYGAVVLAEILEIDEREDAAVMESTLPPPELVPAAELPVMSVGVGVIAAAVAAEALRRAAAQRFEHRHGQGRDKE